jgi:hypothetical protein
MRHWFVCIATAVAINCCASAARAQTDVLAYSFEADVPPNGPDGYFGLGATVTQEPVLGVTHLENSMKYDVAAGDGTGFVGARTEAVIPPLLNNPPGVAYVKFDMNIPAAYGGTFADIGITLFGHDLNPGGGTSFGNQVQFADTVSIAALGAGQHNDLTIDLDLSVGPYRGGESFNQIFGTDDNDLSVASAFQFFISKNTTSPVTVYIDNVRIGVLPEPATWGLLSVAAMAFGMVRRRSHR